MNFAPTYLDWNATTPLDPAVRDAMPTFDLAGAALTWTMAAAELRVTELAGREAYCVPRL